MPTTVRSCTCLSNSLHAVITEWAECFQRSLVIIGINRCASSSACCLERSDGLSYIGTYLYLFVDVCAGMTPLHQAVIEGNMAVVALLIQHSAEVNKQDADSWTPLHAACAEGHVDIAR